MDYLNGIKEISNPLIIIAPIVLMILSGYAMGIIMSKTRKVESVALRDLTNGNLLLIFIFISGFVIFGVIGTFAKSFFFAFDIILVILSISGLYFIYKKLFENKIKNWNFTTSIPILLMSVFVMVLIAYHAAAIYSHPIFEEYDAIYNYLLASKSILLGNGLHHDFYNGTNIPIRSPPLINAINAWIIDSFGYTSMRLFPIYFVILSSLYVYRFGRKITNDSFLGAMAAAIFLVTPAILVISSRFTLNLDLSLILFLTSSFYFMVEVITQKKIARTDLLMLVISLSVMPLSKELGLIFSFAILCLVLFSRFTNKDRKIKLVLSLMSLLPLYILTFKDINDYGITPVLLIRLVSVLLSNIGLVYFLSRFKNYESISPKMTIIYFVPLIIPLIFVSINLVQIHGPYPIMMFSEGSGTSASSFKDIFSIQNKILLSLPDALEKIPRLDILFTASALGTIFIFFKISGFATLVRKFKANDHYAVILTVFVLLVIIWSYFDLGFESSNIRHVGYFAPIFAIIITLSMRRSENHYRLLYYGIMAFSAYYFLFNDIQVLNRDNHFEGFWIDQYKSSIITTLGLEVSAALVLSVFVIRLKQTQIANFLHKVNFDKIIIRKSFVIPILFIIVFGLHTYTLTATGLLVESPEKNDVSPAQGWEQNQLEIIDFLNKGESGNVLSLQSPAISFFTNRTNYELFDPHTFTYFYTTLQSDNSTSLKEKLQDLNIRYIVLPNEKSPLYNEVRQINQNYSIIRTIEDDDDFLKINFKDHEIFKFGGTVGTDLILQNQTWVPFYHANILQNNGSLIISVLTNNTDQEFNRATAGTNIGATPPVLLSLTYSTASISGNATFYAEFTDKESGQVAWGAVLNQTQGQFAKQIFDLPDQILNKPLEMRFFIITNSPGQHTLAIKDARVTHI